MTSSERPGQIISERDKITDRLRACAESADREGDSDGAAELRRLADRWAGTEKADSPIGERLSALKADLDSFAMWATEMSERP